MPYKLRNSRRHKFPKTRYKITNWKEYNQALINRGSVILHLPDDVIKAWQPRKCKNKLQGGQFKYSDIAIETAIAVKICHAHAIQGNPRIYNFCVWSYRCKYHCTKLYNHV